MIKRFLITFLVGFISLYAASQEDVETIADVKLSSSVIKLGEQINMELTLSTFVSDTVIWPLIGDTLITEIEVLDRTTIDTVINPDNVSQKIYTQTYTLTSFDSGYFEISPITIIVNGNPTQTRPFLIEVQTVAVEQGDGLKDIKALIEDDLTFADYVKLYWPFAAGAILLGLLIWLIIKYLKSKKPTIKSIIPQKPKDPPHVIALRRLKELNDEKLWQNNKEKEFHTRLSEILREYLEGRFKVLALEQSSYEITEQFKGGNLLGEGNFFSLKDFLSFTDLVKFAKQKPLPDENKKYFDIAKTLIESTIPEEKAESQENKENKEVQDAA